MSNARLLALLKRLQWSASSLMTPHKCPECGGNNDRGNTPHCGHQEDCELFLAIEFLKGQPDD